MARSISFLIDGGIDTLITITELLDGSLLFEIDVQGTGSIGDLQGLFFDLTDPDTNDPLDLSTLSVTATGEHEITAFKTGEADVTDLGKGVNVNGEVANTSGAFDVGVRFGTPGIGKDDIRSTSFILSGDGLSLDHLSMTDLALRYTSVGEEGGDRDDSLKIAGATGGVALDDAFAVDENATNGLNLLDNDPTPGSTITAVEGGFVQTVVVDGLELGTLTVLADGTATFDANGADVDSLAFGDPPAIFTRSYSTTAPDGLSTATAELTVSVVGQNDAPEILIEPGDSDVAVLQETDALVASGTLTVRDADRSDLVTAAVTGALASGNLSDQDAPDLATLQAMLTLAPADVLDSTETVDATTWTFDAGTTAFDYLAFGESVTVDYTVEVEDEHGATDAQTVSVTIEGVNTAPDITLGGDTAVRTLPESDAGLVAGGSLDLTDPDRTDLVTVAVTGISTGGAVAGLPDEPALLAMLSLSPAAVLDATETADSFGWTFDSGSFAFEYLPFGGAVLLDYEITADDGQGGTDTQTVTIEVVGANDAPVAEDVSVETTQDELVDGAFDFSDPDLGDQLAVEILTDPVDASGIQRGAVRLNDDGTFTYAPGAHFLGLSEGQTEIVTFTYQVRDDSGAPNDTSNEATATVVVAGLNDAPEIGPNPGSDNANLLEGVTPLFAEGFLTVRDPDLPDLVDVELVGVTSSDPAKFSVADLTAMFSFGPTDVIDGTEVEDRITWTFDSGDETFDALSAVSQLTAEFTLRATDSNGATDEHTVTIVIEGTEAPNIVAIASDSATIEIDETDAPLSDSALISILDGDEGETIDFGIVSASAVGSSNPNRPGSAAVLGMFSLDQTTFDIGPGLVARTSWNFDSGTETFDYLREGETLTLVAPVVATDSNGRVSSDSTNTNLVDALTVTITGTNDKPFADTVVVGDGLAIDSRFSEVTDDFEGSDIDFGDTLSYEIISQPVDIDSGLQLGTVVNNGDGTFTFELGDDFDSLPEGGLSELIFEYVAIDDSGADNDTSDVAQGLISVFNAPDVAVVDTSRFLFMTEDQSQFDTGGVGDVTTRQNLPFVGLDFAHSFRRKLVDGDSFAGGVLQDILEGLTSFANAVADAGCDIAEFFTFGLFDDCDVEIPELVVVPDVTMGASVKGKVGLQPFFEASEGALDSTIPVDVAFTTPGSVLAGSGFTIGTELIGLGAASDFTTETPEITFGIDLIFELFAEAFLDVDAGALETRLNLLPRIDEALSINLFTFDGDIDSVRTDIPGGFRDGQFRYGDSSLTISEPDLDLTGNLLGTAQGSDIGTLQAGGESVIADLTLDVDDLASRFTRLPPLSVNKEVELELDVDGVGVDLNLLTLDIALDLIDVDIINQMSLVQDLTMSIEELPLAATFEDGTVLSGLFVGDDIVVADGAVTDTDGNGFLDFDVDIDMGAVMDNLTTLGFSTELFLGLLRADVDVESDFIPDFEISLFNGNEPGTERDGFLFSDSFTFFETDELATINDTSDFDLAGFESNPGTQDSYDGSIDLLVV